MKYRFFWIIVIFSLNTVIAQTIQLNSLSTSTYCSTGQDTFKFSLNYTNIPPNSNIVFYQSTNPSFNPYAGQGDSIGFINVGSSSSGGGGQVTTTCPEILGIFIDACDQGGTLREVDNEYMVITSGNTGFNVSDLKIQLPNTSINVSGCPFLTPSAATMTALRNGTCNATNLIAAGQADFIPANAIVIIFTGRGTLYNYNFSSYCSSGQPIYILQNSCSPGTANFVNNSPGSCPSNGYRTTTTTVGTCTDKLTYFACTLPPFDIANPNANDGNYVIHLPNTDTSSITNGGIRNNAADKCNGLRFDSISGATIIKFPIPNDGSGNGGTATNFCNDGLHYIKAITNPNGTQPISNTLQFKLICLDVTTNVNNLSICSGQNAAVNISSSDPNATFSWTLSGGSSITGASAGTGSSINQTLNYSGATKDSITYNITASDGGCTKTTSVKVVVNKCTVCTPDFSAPDTVCVGQNVSLNNLTGSCVTTNYWNFCSGNLDDTPIGTNLGNVGGVLNFPVFIALATDNGIKYSFAVNHVTGGGSSNGQIIKYKYGGSYNNVPVVTNLGDFGISNFHKVQELVIRHQNNEWIGLVPTQTGDNIVRLNFGSSLDNVPTATDLGNIGGILVDPYGLYVFQDGNNWYGTVTNPSSNSLVRLSFGTSLNNMPVATNLGNVGGVLNGPGNTNTINVNNNWHTFISNRANSRLIRLDYGASLLNAPTAVDLGTLGVLSNPRGIRIIKDCGRYFGFVSNENNTLTSLDFSNGINSVPVATNLGNIATFNFPHSISDIVRQGDSIFMFIPNVNNNTISKILFKNCTNSSIPFSTLTNPPSYTYNQTGIYNVSLTINEGQPSQNTVCKSIVVVDTIRKPDASINNIVCTTDSIRLRVNNIEPGVTYSWSGPNSFSSNQPNVSIKYIGAIQDGQYIVTATGKCNIKKDTVSFQSGSVNFDFGANTTSVCLGGNISLDASTAYDSYLWSTGAVSNAITITSPGKYWVDVFKNGCKGTDTIQVIQITKEPKPNLGPDISVCSPVSQNLTTGNINTTWYQTNTSNQVGTGASFTATQFGTFIAKVSNSCGDVLDTIVITQTNTQTPINLGNDTAYCGAFSRVLSTGNAATVWSTGVTAASITVTTPGTYTATINVGCGVASDAITIAQSSGISFDFGSNTTSVCSGSNISLGAGNAFDSYLWSTGAVTNTITITQPGIYWIDVFKNGCKASDTITVIQISKEPKPNIGRDTSYCGTFSQTLSTGNAQTEWFRDNVLVATAASLQINQTGTYVARISNSCGAVADTIVISGASALALNLGRDTAICTGASITLNATTNGTGITYNWNTGAQTPTISVSQFGIYFVEVSNGLCKTADTINIDILTKPTISSLGNDTSFCGNFSYTLFTGDANTIWSTGTVGPSVNVTQPGRIIAENRNQCGSAADMVFIQQFALPQLNLGKDTTICDSIILSVGNGNFLSILWNTNDTTNSIVANTAGVFSVSVSNTNCTNTDSIRIRKECFYEVYIPTAFSPNGDNFNDSYVPLSDIKGVQVISFLIFNRWGEKVYEAENFAPNDSTKGWNGTYKGENCQVDHYVYYYSVKLPDDKVKIYKGTFALLR